MALIDFNKKRKSTLRIMSPSEKERYKISSTVERTNSHLKIWFIPDKTMLKDTRK